MTPRYQAVTVSYRSRRSGNLRHYRLMIDKERDCVVTAWLRVFSPGAVSPASAQHWRRVKLTSRDTVKAANSNGYVVDETEGGSA